MVEHNNSNNVDAIKATLLITFTVTKFIYRAVYCLFPGCSVLFFFSLPLILKSFKLHTFVLEKQWKTGS